MNDFFFLEAAVLLPSHGNPAPPVPLPPVPYQPPVPGAHLA